MNETSTSLDAYRTADEFMRIFRSAVRKAQAESRRMGVANVYWIHGQRYYELPNGEFTRTRPDKWEPARTVSGSGDF
jgi:hypothetical protein